MSKTRIPINMRRSVIERDGPRCVFCGQDLEPNEIHLDHVIPEARGGETTRQNLQVTCRKCNQEKGALGEAEFMERLRRRAIMILERIGRG